ncbi:MAG: enoyl-CoA hydratase/isomerase family protein [Veillonella sp.]|nr:enoyl-CoA hydratase/isomerase family protein [Veillonella sp.]
MIYNTIQYVVDNGIGTLTFNRPTVANGFNIEMCKEILEVLDKAHNDESVRALLINAEGKVFSAGGDLTEMERAVNEGDTESLFEIVELVAEISMAMKKLPKPAPDAGGLFLLTRSIGMNRAMHIVMTGEAVSAEKGKELGFVYKVCELEDLETATRRLVEKLAKGPAQSYRVMKEMMWNSFLVGWEEYKKFEVENQCKLGLSEDFKEGVRAFTERRRPKFGQQ